MKNYTPVILAVLLGLAAVVAVSRMLRQNQRPRENEVDVAAALRDLNAGDVLQADALQKKVIPVSARPANAILWSKHTDAVGQRLKHPIRAGDYLLTTDMQLERNMSSLVGEGEWAVTLPANSAGIGRGLQPGDEVAVIATFPLETSEKTLNPSQTPRKTTKTVTLVLFPRVRVLDNGTSSRSADGGSEVVLALPPQQALQLIAAQGKAQLTLALRRPADTAALKRSDTGMVEEKTFEQLMDNIKLVEVPDGPEERKR